jgi:hypothetical protein
MESTWQVSRTLRLRRRRRPTRHRPRAGREAHSFEALEVRLLLSTSVPGSSTQASGLLPLPADVAAQLPAGPYAPSNGAGALSGSNGTRDDSYTLDAGDGNPTIQVDLIWPEGAYPLDGNLLVSDASGTALYDVPLTGVHSIDASLPIPSPGGGSSNLVIKLQIDGTASDASSAGTYHLEVHWARSTQAVGTTGSSSPDSQETGTSTGTGSGDSGENASPGRHRISVTRSLPPVTPPPSNTPGGMTGGGGGSGGDGGGGGGGAGSGDGGGGSGSSTGTGVVPIVPPPARIVVIPSVPSTIPSSSPGTNPTTSGSVSSGSASASASLSQSPSPSIQVPLPSASGLGQSSIGGVGSRPAIVGPLPLSGSVPDGGIFAYHPGQGSDNDPLRSTPSIASRSDTLEAPEDSPRRRPRGIELPNSLEFPGEWPSIALPFGFETAGSLSSTGAAFLPPLGQPVVAGVARQPEQGGASRWIILYSKMKPRTSLAALLFGSTSLFFGLVAPDCVARLARWQDDRRWKRQFTFGPSKRKPEPALDLD